MDQNVTTNMNDSRAEIWQQISSSKNLAANIIEQTKNIFADHVATLIASLCAYVVVETSCDDAVIDESHSNIAIFRC